MQDIFDKVATHLLTQNQQSYRMLTPTKRRYSYRGEDDRMCAIGCLLNQEHYSSEFEGMAVTHRGVVYYALCQSIGRELSYPEATMMRDLQRAHDLSPVQYWPMHLKSIAYRFRLNCPDILIERLSNEPNAGEGLALDVWS